MKVRTGTRVISRVSTSALHSLMTLFDVRSRDDLTAIRTPPPFRLNLIGSGGWDSGHLSLLKILYDSGEKFRCHL